MNADHTLTGRGTDTERKQMMIMSIRAVSVSAGSTQQLSSKHPTTYFIAVFFFFILDALINSVLQKL